MKSNALDKHNWINLMKQNNTLQKRSEGNE